MIIIAVYRTTGKLVKNSPTGHIADCILSGNELMETVMHKQHCSN